MSQNYEVFGKYILLEKLNQGGMAEIYLAKTPSLGGIAKFLAIKRILPQYSDNADFIEMFKDEAKIALNLVHSNIATIHEFGIVNNLFFLAMTYVEGANLRQIINKLKKRALTFSIEHIVYVIKEVVSALEFAHRCLDPTTAKPLNIIHRDMSPQNIMISFEGEVKLIDFGIAKATSQIENTRAGTLKGKFGYMSPEQAEGQNIDHRTDIFSIGIILWELLASDRLFVASNEINTLRKVRDCQIPSLRKINPAIPIELEAICNKALTRDRNARYQSAADLHRDLTRFLNRQYPDFLPSDFRTFIKSIYSQEILESRLKLVEYSKVLYTHETSMKEEASGGTTTLTFTGDTQPTLTGDHGSIHTAPGASPSNQDIPSFSKLEVQKDNCKRPRKVDLSNLPSLEVTNTKTYTRSASQSIPSYRKRKKKKYPIISVFGTLMFSTVTIFAVYFLLPLNHRRHDPSIETSSQSGLLEESSSTLSSNTDQQMEPTSDSIQDHVRIFVESIPEGASILINNESTGLITPVTIPIKRDQPTFRITIKKPGYVTYSQEIATPNELKTLSFTLQRERVGYINVQVIPSGGTMLFIDGQEIKEPLPLKLYPVPAQSKVRIKAVNPYNGASDEQVVSIEQDRQVTVHLFPALPSSKSKGTKKSNSEKNIKTKRR